MIIIVCMEQENSQFDPSLQIEHFKVLSGAQRTAAQHSVEAGDVRPEVADKYKVFADRGNEVTAALSGMKRKLEEV